MSIHDYDDLSEKKRVKMVRIFLSLGNQKGLLVLIASLWATKTPKLKRGAETIFSSPAFVDQRSSQMQKQKQRVTQKERKFV